MARLGRSHPFPTIINRGFVSAAATTDADAIEATATAVAQDLQALVSSTPAEATATADAQAPSTSVSVNAQTATATGDAQNVAAFEGPTGLIATPVSDTQIDLSWDAVSGATTYDIERDGVTIVFDNPDTDYSDTGLAATTEYTYRVRAVR